MEEGPDMLRVGVFTDNDFSKVNGVTTALRALLDHAPSGVRPCVYTCEDRAVDTSTYVALKSPGIDIPFYREMKMYWPPFRRFVRRAEADRIDVVHLTTPGPVGLSAMYVASQLGLPMVGSFHTDLAAYVRLLSGSDRLGWLMQQYMRWPYGRCTRIFVPSDATRLMLIESRIDPAKIRLWRRGVATDQFTPSRRSADLRARWGVDERRPAILYVGRVSQEKGLVMLPTLTGALRQSGIDHQLVVAGDGPMRPELEAACPGAIFLGTISHEQVADVMASADVFVFPSRTDTAGNVVLEAQASGLPVLVADAGGPREQMVDGRTGFICGDTGVFQARLTQLAADDCLRQQCSAAARAYVLERSWSAALAPVYQAYRDGVARPQPAFSATAEIAGHESTGR